jgi:ankyrin repeat protein
MRLLRTVLFLFTALFGAAGSLVAQDAQAPQDAQSRLWDAAIAGDTAAIRKAVADGAKVDQLDTRRSQNGRLALNWAAWGNHVDAVKLLLELKAPIEGENLTGFTALSHAAETGSIDVVKVLLAAGADPDHMTRDGAKAAEIAEMREHPEIAKLIQDAPRKKKN